MNIISGIIGHMSDLSCPEKVDLLELTSDERASPHFAATTRFGREVRVSLPRGTELQDGDVLCFDDDTAVVVKAKEEDLLFLKPGGDAIAWWAACYQLGNFHRPARFCEEGVLTPNDPLAAQMLDRLGVAVERIHAPFVGRRFGAAGAHHHHHDRETDAHHATRHHDH
ncbi:urease accessory protein UreE [Mesorhizobium sp. SP-1A]|uniref:urease accessory protein UreE n=1 Tax=Mesorhizobium sp. SP-1A TaxID=3077840 RepID=UPI0028F6EF49|nr:urease accessory protein UreE [Mesorhizobium sp. SP-1A]